MTTLRKLPNGGPAFACAAENGHQEGMSMRDYFAAASLPFLVQQYVPDRAAELSYEYADAMLKARGE